MAKHPLLAITLCLTALSALAQPIELDIHKSKLAGFIKTEKALGSVPVANTTFYASPKDLAQPIQFERKEHNLPNLRCFYFFYPKDSTIDQVIYEWDEHNFNKDNDSLKVPDSEIKAFIEKYKQLYQQIAQTYGESKSQGSIDDPSQIKEGNFRRSDKWQPNDSTEIEMNIDLSSRYVHSGFMTTRTSYAISLEISSIDKPLIYNKAVAKLDEEKTKHLDQTFRTFLSNIQSEALEKARTSLTEKARAIVDDAVMKRINKYLQAHDSLVIYSAVMELTTGNPPSQVVQYRFSTDHNAPPAQLVKVAFDLAGKIDDITTIQP